MNWEDLFVRVESAGEEGSFLRIDETHPAALFVGLDDGRRTLLLVCAARPPEPPTLSSIRVEVRKRQDSRWVLAVRLERPELRALFTRLVDDLASAARAGGDPATAMVARLGHWQRLLARAPSGLLDDDELRGLAAELDFLLTEAIPGLGIRAAVEGWLGPLQASKDFVFPMCEVEVKSTRQTTRRVVISSFEQLTDAGRPLFLWSRALELSTASVASAGSIAELVDRVRAQVAVDAFAAAHLDEALRFAGWADRDEYRTRIVTFGASRCHVVKNDFPRLERTQVPAAILEGSYQLDLDRLSDWVVPTWRPESGHAH